MVICPFTPYGLAHGLITCQIWHQWGPDFVECLSPKPLGVFTPFKVLSNCLDLKLCSVIVICSFASFGLAHGPKTCQIRYHWGPDFAEYILSLKQLDGFHFWSSWIFKVKCRKSCITGTGGPSDTERKGCKIIGSQRTLFVALKFDLSNDLDIEFSMSNFEKAVFQEWEGWLTWNKNMWVNRVLILSFDRDHDLFKVKFWKSSIPGMGGLIDMEQKGCDSIGNLTSFVTLTLDFESQIL